MQLRFTKMQGAGNDVIVLDATRAPLALTALQFRRLADRRFGVGADQVLIVEPPPSDDVDFGYRIVNADGGEVEHCGNGARCFMRYVTDHGLTAKRSLRVATLNRTLTLTLDHAGAVSVDMGAPVFEPSAVPFDTAGRVGRRRGDALLWTLTLSTVRDDADADTDTDTDTRLDSARLALDAAAGDTRAPNVIEAVVLSMGNPHAVLLVTDVDTAPVSTVGPALESHPAFPQRVNVGFLQVVDRGHVRMRVHERGAGETLACGTGACAAVVAGMSLGLLDAEVTVDARGGRLGVSWHGGTVTLTGPATTVFEGEISL